MQTDTIALIIVSIFLGVIVIWYFVKCYMNFIKSNDLERIRNNTLFNRARRRGIIKPIDDEELQGDEFQGDELKDEKTSAVRNTELIHYGDYV